MTLVDPETGEVVDAKAIPLEWVKAGPEVRRKRINLDHVAMLVDFIDDLPPVRVRPSGDGFELVDGHHRLAAHREAGRETVPVFIVELGDGAAFLEAVHCNVTHGLVLDHGERQSAAKRILREWPDYSDRAIAAACGLTDKTIASLRPPSNRGVSTSDTPQLAPPRRTGQDGKSRPTPEAAKAQREAIQRAASENPDASDAAIARDTGASRATVAKNRGGLALVPNEPETTDTAVGDIFTPVIDKWEKHPASRRSEKAMYFARFMDRRRIRFSSEDALDRLTDGCPMELRDDAVSEALWQVKQWGRVAEALQSRRPHMEGAHA